MSLFVDKKRGKQSGEACGLGPGAPEGRGLARSPLFDPRFRAHSDGAAAKIGSSASCFPVIKALLSLICGRGAVLSDITFC